VERKKYRKAALPCNATLKCKRAFVVSADVTEYFRVSGKLLYIFVQYIRQPKKFKAGLEFYNHET